MVTMFSFVILNNWFYKYLTLSQTHFKLPWLNFLGHPVYFKRLKKRRCSRLTNKSKKEILLITNLKSRGVDWERGWGYRGKLAQNMNLECYLWFVCAIEIRPRGFRFYSQQIKSVYQRKYFIKCLRFQDEILSTFLLYRKIFQEK